MSKLDQFIAWLLGWVDRAIYVWGGQGETITSTAQIYRMETSNYNALRAIALWIKRGRNAVCFDCSGLLVKWLIAAGFIKYDTTANGLLSMCDRINKSQLKRGDWVFRVRDGKAYHIGVVVEIINGVAYVVESMGRDVGVVKRNVNASGADYWNTFARPRMFKAEIEAAADMGISYQSHIESIGWKDFVSDGEISGTTGKALRLEAIRIIHDAIQYRAHVQDYGWQMWHTSGQVAGTVAQSKRLEAIEIILIGDMASTHDVLYQVHVQDIGWQDWKKNGDTAGTTGESKRVEAIRIKIEKKA